MHTRLVAALLLLVPASGCSSWKGEDTEAVVATADALTHSVEAAQPLRVAFELLDALPEPTPGTSRPDHMLECAAALRSLLPCALVQPAPGGSADQVVLEMPGDGCFVGRHVLDGRAVFTFSGEPGCLTTRLDLSRTLLDERPLGAVASQGSCEGHRSWTARSSGDLGHGYTFEIDGEVTLGEDGRLGVPAHTLEGRLVLHTDEGEWRVQIDDLVYRADELAPREGHVRISMPGHSIEATVRRTESTPIGEAEARVVIDGDEQELTFPVP